MRKIWTRLATVVLVLVVTISFSACSLLATNLDKKYSANINVMTASGDDVAVSRQDLYYAYLQWGYQYANYYSSTEELLEYISTVLINSKILEKKSIEQFGELREAEEALALKQAYQSLDKSLRSSIYEALSIEDKSEEDKEDSNEKEVDKPYQPNIVVSYENGERTYKMNLSSYTDEEGNGMLFKKDYEYYIPTVPGVASAKNVKQAISKMIRNLQSVESGFTKLKAPKRNYLSPENEYFKFLTKTESDVLNREIQRIVDNNQSSILTDRLNTAYNLGFMNLSGDEAKQAWDAYLDRGRKFEAWCESVNDSYAGVVATNIANNAIDYYIQKTTDAINSQANFPVDDMESTLVSSGVANVYYIPQDIANNLFTVSHILIGFTDEQKNEYKRIQNDIKDAENNHTSYDAQNDLNKLYGETMSNGVSASDILIEVDNALNKADLSEKYHVFREFINKYNSDPGMQNLDQLDSNSQPQYEYLMSTTSEKNKMVEAFTKASIDLFNDGVKGAISDLVWTDYGAHIIMYTRDVSDFVATGVSGMEESTIQSLKIDYEDKLFATLTSYGNRTLFDTLVDAYFVRNYSNYRTSKLNEYKSEHQINVIKSEFKNFLKK